MHRTVGSRWWLGALVAQALLGACAKAPAQEPRVVNITAQRFAFDPAEVHLRKGEPVTIRLTSGDVTHGFFQKALGIDTEVSPGKTTELKLTPQDAGRFTIICDHFCGSGHGNMHMTFVVE